MNARIIPVILTVMSLLGCANVPDLTVIITKPEAPGHLRNGLMCKMYSETIYQKVLTQVEGCKWVYLEKTCSDMMTFTTPYPGPGDSIAFTRTGSCEWRVRGRLNCNEYFQETGAMVRISGNDYKMVVEKRSEPDVRCYPRY